MLLNSPTALNLLFLRAEEDRNILSVFFQGVKKSNEMAVNSADPSDHLRCERKTEVVRILLADDRDDEVFLLTEAFRLAGVTPEIVRVSDGQSVLELTAPPQRIAWDVLVLDYHLPVKDGTAVIEQLTQWGILPGWPCAVLSSYLPPNERQRISEMGVRLIAEKPNDLDRLCDLARQIASLVTG